MTSDLGEIGVGAFGPGLAYYFERCNLYLSATFGLAGFSANDGNGVKVDSAKSGAAFDFMVGKEWWVSRDWGARHRRRADRRVAEGQEHARAHLVGERAVDPLLGHL